MRRALAPGGACVVRDAQDVLDAMLGPGARRLHRAGAPLDAGLRDVLAAVEAGAATCDGAATALGLPASEVAAALARLELLGYLACTPLGIYSRTMLVVPSDGSIG